MPGIRADQLALYLQDMYKASRETYKEADTVHDKIFKVVTGLEGAGDKETQILGAGDLVRHTVEGQSVNFKSPIQGYEYLVKYWTYSDGIVLTKEAVEDTVKLGNLLKDLASTWGISQRVEEESLGARVFTEGGLTGGDFVFNGTHTGNVDNSGDLIYDSIPFFALTGAPHVLKSGDTLFNSVAGLSLSAANFETIYNRHTATNNRDERNRIKQNPADTLLVKPGADRFLAERIVDTSRGLPFSQNNDINPYYKIVSVIAWDYLNTNTEEDVNVFYVGKKLTNALQFRKRQMPEIRFFRDEDNLGYKASFNLRMGILVKNFRNWTRGGGSST